MLCWVTWVVSDSVRPHRQQPTRLPRPWDSLGKNTGVGCHFLLQNDRYLLLFLCCFSTCFLGRGEGWKLKWKCFLFFFLCQGGMVVMNANVSFKMDTQGWYCLYHVWGRGCLSWLKDVAIGKDGVSRWLFPDWAGIMTDRLSCSSSPTVFFFFLPSFLPSSLFLPRLSSFLPGKHWL